MTLALRWTDRRLAPLLLALLAAGCAGPTNFTDFPVPPHRPVEVNDRSLRLDRAVEEFMATRGLEIDPGARRPGETVTLWTPVAGIEGGDPPIAECPARQPGGSDPRYRGRYRFTVQRRGGRPTLFVEAHWQTLLGRTVDGADRWVECRSTGVHERNVQDQLVVRARMLSGDG